MEFFDSILQVVASNYNPVIHLLYIGRWAALAIPGAWLLGKVEGRVGGRYKPMLIAQIMLGSVTFFLDMLLIIK